MQVAFKDESKDFSILHLGESLVPILSAEKFAGFFSVQRQKAKHRDIMPWYRSGLICLGRTICVRLIARSKRYSLLSRQERLKILSGNTETSADFVHNFSPHE